MELASPALAFLAGLVSILSPCVLPLLPVVLSTAVSEHKVGPAALAAGLSFSFVTFGLFLATIGFSFGFDDDTFRPLGAILLMATGIILTSPFLQTLLSRAITPASNWIEQRLHGRTTKGLTGQFGLGALLGVVWTPCVGPTLGAASTLAAQGRDLTQVALTMLLFAVGTALPLLVFGLASREALIRWRGRLRATGTYGKMAVGVVLIAMGALVFTGFDKSLEAALLRVTPEWLAEIATRF